MILSVLKFDLVSYVYLTSHELLLFGVVCVLTRVYVCSRALLFNCRIRCDAHSLSFSFSDSYTLPSIPPKFIGLFFIPFFTSVPSTLLTWRCGTRHRHKTKLDSLWVNTFIGWNTDNRLKKKNPHFQRGAFDLNMENWNWQWFCLAILRLSLIFSLALFTPFHTTSAITKTPIK